MYFLIQTKSKIFDKYDSIKYKEKLNKLYSWS